MQSERVVMGLKRKHAQIQKGVQPGDTSATRLHQRTQQEREKQGMLQPPPAPHAGATPAGQIEKR